MKAGYIIFSAAKAAADLSPCLKPGACVSFFGQETNNRLAALQRQLGAIARHLGVI